MEKTEVCFIRLYPDNPEDALIIEGLGARKRKGDKSRVIKDILYAHFSREQSARAESKSKKVSGPQDYSETSVRQTVIESSSQIPAEMPALSEHDKEALKRNLDELSNMLM